MKVRKCDVYTVNDNTIRKGRKLDGVNSIRVKKQKKEKEKKKKKPAVSINYLANEANSKNTTQK